MSISLLVTVITPSFNQGCFIEETVLSVLNQDYPNIEYLVIDGGSTDNTLDILRKYEGRVKWISEPDRGQSHAINKGFQMAKGDILCWLNSDDTYERGAIQQVVEYFCANPDVMMVYGSANLIDEQGNFIEQICPGKSFDLWSVVYHEQTILQPSTFFRKSIFYTISMLDENLHWCMDRDLWIRIGSRFKIGGIDGVFANCRIYPATKTSSGGLRRWLEIVSIQKEYANWTFPFGLLRAGMGAIHMLLKFNHPLLYNYLKNMIFFLKNKTLDNFYRNFHGVYSDNWLGKKARFMFQLIPDYRQIKFIFEMPDDQRLLPNYLTVKSKKVDVVSCTISTSGKFEIFVPYDSTATRPTEIELIFSRSLPPDSQRRRLACKLVSVDFVS